MVTPAQARMLEASERHFHQVMVNAEILERYRQQVMVLESLEFELRVVLEHHRLQTIRRNSPR